MLILFKLYTFSVYCSLTKLKKTKTKNKLRCSLMLMFILYEVSMPVFANVKASWVNFCCFKVYYMNTLTGIKTYSMT